MDISYLAAMQTQPARQHLTARTSPWCALSADRPLSTLPIIVMPHRAGDRADACRTEGGITVGMSSVKSTTPFADVSGCAGAIDDQGDRVGSPTWSPPV